MGAGLKDYWNDKYWNKLLKDDNEDLDFLSDLWLDKYREIFDKIPRGKALDLGCGLGQYTAYLSDKGFDVLSSDLSPDVLKRLAMRIPDAKTMELDMSDSFPFADKSFNLVFANLSIHYFDTKTTEKLLKEINRILTDGGYFIGSVNSSQTFQFIQDDVEVIEPNFYSERGRLIRLWTKEQFNEFFTEYDFDVLEEVTTTRWDRTKIMWEFISRPKRR